MTKSDTGYWNGTWGAGNSNELLSCKNQHLWYEHNTIGVATLWTGAHRFDSVRSLYGKFVRFQTSFVSGDLKTKTIHNRVWYFWWEWYTNLFYLDVDHKWFISGFAALFCFTGFAGFLCLRWADKLNLFLSSSVFMRSFNSYELLINPRLDSVIHNSGFSDSKYSYSFSFKPHYSLFIFSFHPRPQVRLFLMFYESEIFFYSSLHHIFESKNFIFFLSSWRSGSFASPE